MRNKNQKTHIIKWTTAFVLAFLLFAGCRKHDTFLPQHTQNYEELKSQFFDTNSTSDVEIKKLAADIKKQDSIFKFLPDFVRKNGLPKWDKVIYKTKNSTKLNGRQNSSFSPNSLNTSANRLVSTNDNYDNQGLFFIPLQSTNSQSVKSYITAYKHNDSLYTYRIYNKDSLNAIQPSSNEEKNKLLNTQAVFGYFEKSINNIDSINITSPVNATLKNVNIDFDNSASAATSNGNINSFNFGDDCSWSVSVRITYVALLVTDGHLAAIVLVPVSTTILITIDCTGSGGGGGCGCGGTPGNPGGGFPSGTPGGGTPGNTTGGSPSGGSPSNGNTTGNTPHWWNYGTGWPWYGGGGGNNPLDWNWWWTSGGGGGIIFPIADPNGFLYSRIAELGNELALNPYAITPCDSLNIMPLDPGNAFGKMYQRIAQYRLPQYVKNRIDSIRSVAPNFIVDNFNLQSIDEAAGPVVNCDFFPVRIRQLPIGMTAKDLLEHFRKEITQFIDSSVNVSFSPYQDGSFYDTAKFNAPFENSLGALLNIHMLNDGSVILSDYYSNSTPNSQKHRFKFSTIETPADYEHPVAGNREFGIYNDPTRPGEFTFYTMGVDRTWDWLFAAGNPDNIGFRSADRLWMSVQEKMIDFIIANGGQAEFYLPRKVTARPDWDDVKDYLKGDIDFITLKQRLGC